jgi:hypothetical protein
MVNSSQTDHRRASTLVAGALVFILTWRANHDESHLVPTAWHWLAWMVRELDPARATGVLLRPFNLVPRPAFQWSYWRWIPNVIWWPLAAGYSICLARLASCGWSSLTGRLKAGRGRVVLLLALALVNSLVAFFAKGIPIAEPFLALVVLEIFFFALAGTPAATQWVRRRMAAAGNALLPPSWLRANALSLSLVVVLAMEVGALTTRQPWAVSDPTMEQPPDRGFWTLRYGYLTPWGWEGIYHTETLCWHDVELGRCEWCSISPSGLYATYYANEMAGREGVLLFTTLSLSVDTLTHQSVEQGDVRWDRGRIVLEARGNRPQAIVELER